MRTKIFLALFIMLIAGVVSAQTLVDIATNLTDPNNLADAEPSIAVNPANPNQIAVVTFSEGWSAATGARAPIWMSNDGGMTWAKNFVLTAPTPTSTGPGDQKLVYSAAGELFVAELGINVNVPRCFIYRPDGGNWIAGAAYGDDQPMLESTGDTLLSPWLNFGLSPERSMSERTPDDGVTVAQTNIGSAAFPNRTTRIAVGQGGAAYVIYKTREGEFGSQFEGAQFRVLRSLDAGVTWNTPGVSLGNTTTWFTSSWGDAKNGGKVARARSSDAWIAANPAVPSIWAVYCVQNGPNLVQIWATRSTDGGLTWSPGVRVTDGTRNSAFPEIAVAANGAIGVMYIDYDASGPQTVYTHRFARSFTNGAAWTRVALQSLRTQELANGVDGFLWGDYEGLTAQGNTFYGVFTGRSIGRAVVQFDPIFFRMSADPIPIVESIGTVTVDRSRPLAFVKGNDGNLWLNVWSGSAWDWANQGTPPGVQIASGVGVTVVDGAYPYAFVKGSDGNLWLHWWSGAVWTWTNQGRPSGSVGVDSGVGVITVDGRRPHAFVKGSDGNLWLNFYNGSAWAWANQGRPGNSVGIDAPVGAITVDGGRPHVFVKGSDGNLWLHLWNGSAWAWANQGRPSNSVGIDAPVGAITVDGGRPHAFVKGSDGNLWLHLWNGSAWAWANQGRPSNSVGIAAPIGAITVDGGRPHVFVKGSDGTLWLHLWNGSAWAWANQGNPAGLSLTIPAGAIAVDGGRPYAWSLASDGNLYVNLWNGVGWSWENRGTP